MHMFQCFDNADGHGCTLLKYVYILGFMHDEVPSSSSSIKLNYPIKGLHTKPVYKIQKILTATNVASTANFPGAGDAFVIRRKARG